MLFLLGLFLGSASGLVVASLFIASKEKKQESAMLNIRDEIIEGAA